MAGFDMDPGTWRTLNRLLDEALEVPARDREKWFAALSPEVEALKPRLRALLAHASAEAAFGTLPKLNPEMGTGSGADIGASSDRTGETIGPYVLTKLLAEGGMGAGRVEIARL
jgi:hypothetical protein